MIDIPVIYYLMTPVSNNAVSYHVIENTFLMNDFILSVLIEVARQYNIIPIYLAQHVSLTMELLTSDWLIRHNGVAL